MTVKEMIEKWEENNKNNISIPKEKLNEFAVMCLSLSNTWFDNVKNEKEFSYEAELYDKKHKIKDELQGINRDNLPYVLLEAITFKKDELSEIKVNSFNYKNGMKNGKKIGELGIE